MWPYDVLYGFAWPCQDINGRKHGIHAIGNGRRTSPICAGTQPVFRETVFPDHRTRSNAVPIPCIPIFIPATCFLLASRSPRQPGRRFLFQGGLRDGKGRHAPHCSPLRNGQAAHGPHTASRASLSPRLSFPSARARPGQKGFLQPGGVPFSPLSGGHRAPPLPVRGQRAADTNKARVLFPHGAAPHQKADVHHGLHCAFKRQKKTSMRLYKTKIEREKHLRCDFFLFIAQVIRLY